MKIHVDIDPLGANEMPLKLIIFIQENFQFLMNLITPMNLITHVTTILEAYFVWN